MGWDGRRARGWALTEHVDEGKVDSGAAGGATTPVEQGLGIEGGAPGEEVDPAEDAREKGEQPVGHGLVLFYCLLSTGGRDAMRDRGKKGKKGGDRIRTDKDTKRGIERAERERRRRRVVGDDVARGRSCDWLKESSCAGRRS